MLALCAHLPGSSSQRDKLVWLWQAATRPGRNICGSFMSRLRDIDEGQISTVIFLLAMGKSVVRRGHEGSPFLVFLFSCKGFFLGRRDIFRLRCRTEWIRGVAGWLSAPGQTDLLFCYSGNDEYPRIYGAFLCTCSPMLSSLTRMRPELSASFFSLTRTGAFLMP